MAAAALPSLAAAAHRPNAGGSAGPQRPGGDGGGLAASISGGGRACSGPRLGLLLPVTSRGCAGPGDLDGLVGRLRALRASLDDTGDHDVSGGPKHLARLPPPLADGPSARTSTGGDVKRQPHHLSSGLAAAPIAAAAPTAALADGPAARAGSAAAAVPAADGGLSIGDDTPRLTSTSTTSSWAGRTAGTASTAVADVCVALGVDEHDAALRAREGQLLGAFAGVPVRLVVFGAAELAALPPGPVCWMWGRLAEVAARELGATHLVLLGDDVRMEPPGWPRLVLSAFQDHTAASAPRTAAAAAPATMELPSTIVKPAAAAAAAPAGPSDGPTTSDPTAVGPTANGPTTVGLTASNRRRLRCLALLDAADPGYPSFPVLDAQHLDVFGSLLPPGLFVNQMGDPFLAELYRRLGALGSTQAVVVHNGVGGIQLPDDAGYTPPRYPRTYPPMDRVLQALDAWTAVGAAAWGGRGPPSVDVLVPCGRAQPGELRAILEGCEGPPSPGAPGYSAADVRFGAVVDCAHPSRLPGRVRRELEALRDERLGRVRLRFNASNQGASRTRNRALDESLAELVVLLDDDVVPEPGLVGAYAAAAAAHPEARGFTGPTFLPRGGSACAHAVHMSDVSFFWDLPASGLVGRRSDGSYWLPWAVTANLALRNTGQRFARRFPRTGGGEDIDFCLRACPGGLLAVPQAACRHPLWNGGRPDPLRFAKWALGDGQLIEIYPRLSYRAAPNAPELLLLLAAAHAAALALWAAAGVAAAAVAAAAAMDGSGLAGAGGVLNCLAAASAAGRAAAAGSAAAALGVAAAEFVLEMVRHCLNRDRLARHPCPSWSLRLRGAALAALYRAISEAGRLWGHASRAFAAPAPAPVPTPVSARSVPGRAHPQAAVEEVGAAASADGGASMEAAAAAVDPREAADAAASSGDVPEGGVRGGGLMRFVRLYGMRFDWFCGLDVRIVRQEQMRAAARALALAATGAAAATAAVGGGIGVSWWPVAGLGAAWAVGVAAAVIRE